MKVVIIDYGAGNVFSVQQAFKRLGIETLLTNEKTEIESATHVIFPGVGHAKSAMKQLRRTQLDRLIPHLKQPVLGICLGMQLMCRASEEGNTQGLGIFDVSVRQFKSDDRSFNVPHMGWNDVAFTDKTESFYFVHSYFVPECTDTWGKTDYIHPFSAALQRDNFFGVQFHPEKSGEAGAQLLQYFLNQN